jgi:hypothetical protein
VRRFVDVAVDDGHLEVRRVLHTRNVGVEA